MNASRHASPLGSELIMAALAVTGITILYLGVVVLMGVPAASGLFGHMLGVFGFLLMIATETLYSFRKRAFRHGWGRMSDWLKFHIFTGIVGPYLVFLHSAWSFKGLAGVTLLLTGIIVLSGFVGRYIYTAVPRTAEGELLEAAELRRQITLAEAALRQHLEEREIRIPSLAAGAESSAGIVLGRSLFDWRHSIGGWLARRAMDPQARRKAAEIEGLIRRRRELQRQIASRAVARRMLAVWHTVHIPLGMSLFVLALIHAGAALYYATLLK